MNVNEVRLTFITISILIKYNVFLEVRFLMSQTLNAVRLFITALGINIKRTAFIVS